MTRGKKILIGVGVVVILGALAFANIKFKRQEGTVVNVETVQKRDLQAIVSASGKIQPQRLVNISADTMGRVTNLAVDEGTAKSMGTDAEGIFLSASYVTGIETAANKTFLADIARKFGKDAKTPNDLSVPEYEAVYAYKAAVEKAGSTDGAARSSCPSSITHP